RRRTGGAPGARVSRPLLPARDRSSGRSAVPGPAEQAHPQAGAERYGRHACRCAGPPGRTDRRIQQGAGRVPGPAVPVSTAVDPEDLCGATQTGAVFDSAVWAGAEIDELELDSSSLHNLRATAGRWERCTFIDCQLMGADLAALATRDVGLVRVRLDRARLTGSSWVRSRWREVHLAGGVADDLSAHSATWTDVTLTGTSLREADFTGAQLQRVHFADCDLRGARFLGVRAQEVSFTQCHLDGAQGSADLRGATMRSEEHTSELQSRFDLVCRLLLEKKKVRR